MRMGSDWVSFLGEKYPVLPLKRLFRIVNGATPSSSDGSYWDGDVPWATPEDLGKLSGRILSATKRTISHDGYLSCGTTMMPAGNIVLSTRALIGHVAMAASNICTNQGCKGLIPRKSVHSTFFYFVLLAAKVELQSRGKGTTFAELSYDALAGFPVPVPNENQQHEIADFLDREAAKIDGLLEGKLTLLLQLTDQERSIITRTVCRGLDGSARMRASDIPWIGDMPAHWELLHLRRIVKKFVDYRGRTPEKVLEGIPLVTAVNIKNGRIDMSLGQEFMPEADYDDWMVRGLPERGDLLVTTEAPLGEVAQIEDTRVALAQRIILLKVNKQKITNEYLKYFFRSGAGQGELLTRASGSTALGIKASRFKGIAVVVPPLGEQHATVEYLDHETSRLTQLKVAVVASLPKLAEYRSSLISAAVTGKIDVCTYRPQEVAVLCQ